MLAHYRLVEKLGEGGMGVVWRAEDTVLRRTVAIKVLPATLSLDESRRKLFLDEARHAASVSDSHIAHVYDLGNSSGIDFIVMELVDGRTLDRLIGGRPLPLQKVARWGEQIARGLSRAHRKLLLHRDLKPANIMISQDGEVKIVDFGIAALLPEDQPTAATTITMDPVDAAAGRRIVGTLPYMSPEQVRGEPLDVRSDIFSLGVVLYEMSVGQRPFSGQTPHDIATAILAGRIVPPHQLVSGVPVDLERILLKALCSDRAERYQTVDDLAIDLKRLGKDLDSGESLSFSSLQTRQRRHTQWMRAPGFVLAAALAVVGGFVLWQRVRTFGTESARTILIEPLVVSGTADGAGYLGRALAEAVAIDLAQARDARVLDVPERPSARSALSAHARTLGAGRILTGTIVKSNGSLQVQALLLESHGDRILWGTQEAIAPDGISQFAATLAGKVAETMSLTLGKSYEYFRYVTGSSEMSRSPVLAQTLGAARRHDIVAGDSLTRELLRVFPNEPDAHVLRIVVLQDRLNASSAPDAREALLSALDDLERVDRQHPLVPLLRVQESARDSESVIRHWQTLTRLLARTDLAPAFRAHVLRTRALWYPGSFPDRGAAAIRDVNESIRLDPGNTYSYAYAVQILAEARRFDEAQERARQSLALESSGMQAAIFCDRFMQAGRDDLALAWARIAAAIDPRRPYILDDLWYMLSRNGLHEEALGAGRELCKIEPSRQHQFAVATELAFLGRREEARAESQAAASRPQSGSTPSLEEARYLAVTGSGQEALNALRQILAADGLDHATLSDTAFAALRTTAGFRALDLSVDGGPR
jgi:TolB-like protein/tetratricopeptide (TPR) repeat protein/predicted Ser/Thr protein kinase